MAMQASPHSAASVCSTTGVVRAKRAEMRRVSSRDIAVTSRFGGRGDAAAQAVDRFEYPLIERAGIDQQMRVDLHAGLQGLLAAIGVDEGQLRPGDDPVIRALARPYT